MQIHTIDTPQDFKDLQNYVRDQSYAHGKIEAKSGLCTLQFEDHEQFNIELNKFDVNLRNEIYTWVQPFKKPKNVHYSIQKAPVCIVKETNSEDALIFGKDSTQNVVSVEVKDNVLELFIEKDGVITSEFRDNKFWILSSKKFDASWVKLEGNLHYQFIKYYDKRADFYGDKARYRQADIWSISDPKEAAMVLQGITYYKGMKVADVSILHFDLETKGLVEDNTSGIFLISTTYKAAGKLTEKLFAVDEYEGEKEMIEAFCEHVRTINPSIVSGFNCYGYDFRYLAHCADLVGAELNLGRDGSALRFDKYPSKFRKDGSQDYEYLRCWIYGREVVDMMHVAVHFDFARKYESYGLKKIIAHEGLETPGRQFYDASQISKNWDNLEERAKIKQYCIDDSDDNDKLYQLMIPAYFYLTPSIPKSFQQINFSATGSQINSFLVRSYLQNGHSIPKASEVVNFVGAISDGYPGSYSNVFKVDVASLYPSIILQYNIYDKDKDPSGHFLKMVSYFTKQRLENKKKGKDNRYFKDLEQAQKIVINSSYGLLGMHANFNSPTNGALVTTYGREILKKAYLWASGVEYVEKTKEETTEEKEDT